MDDNRKAILSDSNKTISKLQLLSVFFGDDIIYKIYLRSQVIHQLFEDNTELDINKLELFHLQFTQTLIELLKQIKKSNEKSVLILLDEIQINKDLVDKIKNSLAPSNQFRTDQQQQALKINSSLRKLYQALADNSSDYPFAKNINAFSSAYAGDFFYPIQPALMNELLQYNPPETRSNAYATIDKKLLDMLADLGFGNSFYCGLKAADQFLEVYRVNNTDQYFIYSPSKQLFLFCDITKIESAGLNNELSKKEQFIQELTDKNDQLNNSINNIKTTIPPGVKQLLFENYRKLNEINFLQSISEVNVQANILKSMLNTNMI